MAATGSAPRCGTPNEGGQRRWSASQRQAEVTILCGKGSHLFGGGTRIQQAQRERLRLGSTTEESLMLIKKVFLAPAALAVALAVALACTAIATPGAVAQEKTAMVGGAAMYPSMDIIDNAVNSKHHTTLVAAVKAAGLVDTLKGAGPFTVFAPTNEAFAALPAGTIDTLLKPANKAQLTKILTYHVVAARVDAAALMGMINKDGGKHAIKTVAGDTLTASAQGGNVVLTDAKGGMSTVTQVDVFQKNGVIHVVDKVLLP
jgi:uncharacterized surface protein with fasciclin (FAS1) repeats